MGAENGPGPVQAEMLNVQIFGKYNQGGRVIFDISKPLTTALLMTDADDIPCGELAFPSELRISAIVDACFRLIVDGVSAPSWTRGGCAKARSSMYLSRPRSV